ncbi:VOC family protein [Sulfitobacter aestuarii]|uniref:VOC family protein n=1 Tax=Sulfitobacter aestuarii TaxID=2161676 RepID=A0ABW5U674_9RHOB
MRNREGTPIWYELMTQNPDVAQDFYGKVMGWSFEAMPAEDDMDYRVASAGGAPIAGVMRKPEHAQAMPDMWFAYIAVKDVDAAAEKVKALGGRVDMEPDDIPDVGRFAFCSDPQGAHFYLMRTDSDEASAAFTPMKPGHACWNELVTTDQKAALDFYGKLFGWEHGGAMSMGPAGEYIFLNHEGDMIGAVMEMPEKDTKPYWNFALQVTHIDKARSTVEQAGGLLRIGPTELPDNAGWLIQTDDPQGAKMMFVGNRKGEFHD